MTRRILSARAPGWFHVLFTGVGILATGLGVGLLTGLLGNGSADAVFWGKYNCVYGGFLLVYHGSASWRWMERRD